MNKYKLICQKENYEIINELLKTNNIITDQTSTYVICEDGIIFNDDYDIVIYFKKEKISQLIKLLKSGHGNKPSIIMGKSDDSYVPIAVSNIVFFNAYGNDTFGNTISGNRYKVKFKLYELESQVLPRYFIRINKSEIVNIKHITKIIPMFKGKLILKMQGYKEPVDISRNYVKGFKERIGM